MIFCVGFITLCVLYLFLDVDGGVYVFWGGFVFVMVLILITYDI